MSKREQENLMVESKNWRWQWQNAARDWNGLVKLFPALRSGLLAESYRQKLSVWLQKGFRLLITPYAASLVKVNENGYPQANDPVWRQLFPVFDLQASRQDDYSPEKENWEKEGEWISPIAQQKYDNRVLLISCDLCLGYCVYCFRSLQSGSKGERHGGITHWEATLKAIAARPQIEEVILSGGDPLIYDNDCLEKMLADLRRISHVRAIRLHTRAWLHNPMRIDDDFCRLLREYRVTEMGVHAVHPVEISGEFEEAARKVRELGGVGLLLADIPLIRGINDSVEVLRELLMKLYLTGVKPYYLSHNMPNVPAATEQRTTVLEGLRLWKKLKRHLSNPAMPEYVICHQDGKQTVPEYEGGSPEFVYSTDQHGAPAIRFLNWKGSWSVYPDGVPQGRKI